MWIGDQIYEVQRDLDTVAAKIHMSRDLDGAQEIVKDMILKLAGLLVDLGKPGKL